MMFEDNIILAIAILGIAVVVLAFFDDGGDPPDISYWQ